MRVGDSSGTGRSRRRSAGSEGSQRTWPGRGVSVGRVERERSMIGRVVLSERGGTSSIEFHTARPCTWVLMRRLSLLRMQDEVAVGGRAGSVARAVDFVGGLQLCALLRQARRRN